MEKFWLDMKSDFRIKVRDEVWISQIQFKIVHIFHVNELLDISMYCFQLFKSVFHVCRSCSTITWSKTQWTRNLGTHLSLRITSLLPRGLKAWSFTWRWRVITTDTLLKWKPKAVAMVSNVNAERIILFHFVHQYSNSFEFKLFQKLPPNRKRLTMKLTMNPRSFLRHILSDLVSPSTFQFSTMKSRTTQMKPANWPKRFERDFLKLSAISFNSISKLRFLLNRFSF